jgi:hypothetical protein
MVGVYLYLTTRMPIAIHARMPKPSHQSTSGVRARVQVYLAADDCDLLALLTGETGLSKAEILRRGVRSFAREHRVASPMLKLAMESDTQGWPDDLAKGHDAVLAASYRSDVGKKRR